MVQWEVTVGDGESVRHIVQAAGLAAIGDRLRVFLNGRRADLDDPVDEGDWVEIRSPEEHVAPTCVTILTQRDGIVLAHKPAGVPTEPTPKGVDSVVTELVRMLSGAKVHAASRLDVPVSGVVLCTLGSDAIRRVNHWREAGQLERVYLALARGRLPERGVWDAPLGRHRDRAGRPIASPYAPKLRAARTGFECLAAVQESEDDVLSLLRLVPETGRMHQLRAHAALAGAPLLGDRLYGGSTTYADPTGKVHNIERVALHAWRVALPSLAAVSGIPNDLREWWRQFGGSDRNWYGEA